MRAALLTAALLGAAPLALPADDEKPDLTKLLDARTFKDGEASLNYRLLKPDGYDGTKAFPLVVFLHGAGERGDNNKAQLVHGIKDFASKANREKYPCFLIAPQCPKGGFWSNTERSKTMTMKKDPSPSGKLVVSLIAAIRKEFKIDEKRIYITGLSMGGFGSFDLLCRNPDLFAAGAPICGGGDPKACEKIAKIPLWVFHGDKDTAVPIALSVAAVEAIEKAGGKPKFTKYEGVGHDSWTRTYADPKFMEWLFAQKKDG
jgi:predicted peptidase